MRLSGNGMMPTRKLWMKSLLQSSNLLRSNAAQLSPANSHHRDGSVVSKSQTEGVWSAQPRQDRPEIAALQQPMDVGVSYVAHAYVNQLIFAALQRLLTYLQAGRANVQVWSINLVCLLWSAKLIAQCKSEVTGQRPVMVCSQISCALCTSHLLCHADFKHDL